MAYAVRHVTHTRNGSHRHQPKGGEAAMRRASGKGCIVQLEKDRPRGRCRKWQLRVSTGKSPADGKYHCRTRRVTGTFTEAKQQLHEFVNEIDAERDLGQAPRTFQQECERLLRNRRASGNYSDSRMRQLEIALKTACLHIGQANFCDVTPGMLNDLYAKLRGGKGTLSGKPATGTYVRSIHHAISLVYNQAIREERCKRNPCRLAEPPKIDSQPRRALSSSQLNRLVAGLRPTRERDCAWLLAAAMGLRRGEICGLSWGDVSFEENLADVHCSYGRNRKLKSPKTAAGMRLLPLTPELASALKAHRQAQLARGLACEEQDPVVVTRTGTRVHPDIMERWWAHDRDELGLSGFCLHELRHSYLTELARAGVHPKVMQELAGHANSKITMDIYTHVNMEGKRQAAEQLRRHMACSAPALDNAAITQENQEGLAAPSCDSA